MTQSIINCSSAPSPIKQIHLHFLQRKSMFISHRKCKEATFPLLLNPLMQQSTSVFNEVYHVGGEGTAGGVGGRATWEGSYFLEQSNFQSNIWSYTIISLDIGNECKFSSWRVCIIFLRYPCSNKKKLFGVIHVYMCICACVNVHYVCSAEKYLKLFYISYTCMY